MLIGQRPVHPNMFKQLGQFYRQVATIQKPIEARSIAGAIETTWQGMIAGLPCQLANSAGLGSPETREVRGDQFTTVTENWHVTFKQTLPTVTIGYRVIVTGFTDQAGQGAIDRTFDITGIETDAQTVLTRFKLQEVDY